MAGRKISVMLVGDSDSLEKAFDRANRKGKQFDSQMGRSSSSLKGFAKAGLAGAAAAGTALVVKGLMSSVSAAKEAQVAQVNLQQALKQSGNSYKRYGAQIENAIQKTSKAAAIDDEELSAVFANLVRSTGSVSKATKGMALAANIARARNIPLATSAKAVERAYKGSDTALKRVGVVVPKVTRAYDALKAQETALRAAMKGKKGAQKAEIQTQIDAIKQSYKAARASDAQASSQNALAVAQRKFAGSAKTYGETSAGAQERLAIALENVQEKIGQKLLPLQLKLNLAALRFVEWMERNWPRFERIINKSVERVKAILAEIKPILDGLRTYLGGWIKLIEGVLTGDWSLVWQGLKQIVKGAIEIVLAYLRTVPRLFVEAGIKLGKAIGKGVLEGLKGIGEKVVNSILPGNPVGRGKPTPGPAAKGGRTGSTTYRGPRAGGGPVMAGSSYTIGERGPETLVMGSRSGYVVPNGAGGISIGVVNVHGVQNVPQLLSELQRIARHGVAQQRGRYGGVATGLG